MRWLCARGMTVALLTTLAAGCGSTGGTDSLVFQFLHFDNTGITQADSVSETSADVDIVQDMCLINPEPFTVTTINAVFRNHEAADLHLNKMVIDVGPNAGRAPITRFPDGVIPGGRCSNIDQQCASDADCQGTVGACGHTDTTISGLVLFDFQDKAVILPGTYNVSITFSASDPFHTFENRTGYVVTFDNFNNCIIAGG